MPDLKFKCPTCKLKFCVSHRFPSDHGCQEQRTNKTIIDYGPKATSTLVDFNGGKGKMDTTVSATTAVVQSASPTIMGLDGKPLPQRLLKLVRQIARGWRWWAKRAAMKKKNLKLQAFAPS
mmetsp:Transcript_38132/g.75008  ORF Transcript_38132/g.75008 Transcript_38132/m.75008 type:complete len:121 (-) Transcript_38132:121-483(-)